MQALSTVQDYLQSLIHVQVKRGGSNPGQFRPAARPVSALDRLRTARRIEGIRTLDALVIAPQ